MAGSLRPDADMLVGPVGIIRSQKTPLHALQWAGVTFQPNSDVPRRPADAVRFEAFHDAGKVVAVTTENFL